MSFYKIDEISWLLIGVFLPETAQHLQLVVQFFFVHIEVL